MTGVQTCALPIYTDILRFDQWAIKETTKTESHIFILNEENPTCKIPCFSFKFENGHLFVCVDGEERTLVAWENPIQYDFIYGCKDIMLMPTDQFRVYGIFF